VNIERQLGYTYETSQRFFDGLPSPATSEASVRISGGNKNSIAGSNQLALYAQSPGDNRRQLVALESVLSRWHVSGCVNCQLSADTAHHAPWYGIPVESIGRGGGCAAERGCYHQSGDGQGGASWEDAAQADVAGHSKGEEVFGYFGALRYEGVFTADASYRTALMGFR